MGPQANSARNKSIIDCTMHSRTQQTYSSYCCDMSKLKSASMSPMDEPVGLFEVLLTCVFFSIGYFRYHDQVGFPHPLYATCLGLLGSAAFFGTAYVLRKWQPTRHLGVLLLKRVTETKQNWELYPLRSFSEVWVWLAVIWGTFVLSVDSPLIIRILLSMAMGTLSAITAALLSQLLTTQVRTCSRNASHLGTPAHNPSTTTTAFVPWMIFLGYVGVFFVKGIFDDDRSISIAVTMATLAGVCFIFISELCVQWPPTKQIGRGLVQRWKFAPLNWYNHPIRSAVEIFVWIACIFLTHTYYGQNDYFMAIRVGTMIAMIVCSINTWLFPCSHPVCVSFQKRRASEISLKELPFAQPPFSASERKINLKTGKASVTMQQVAQHNIPEDGWIVLHGQAYDVTKWIARHPGGDVILKFLGADATDQYEAFHQPFTKKYLKHFYVGEVSDYDSTISQKNADYAALRDLLYARGLFDASKMYFSIKHVWLCVFMSLVYFVGFSESSLLSQYLSEKLVLIGLNPGYVNATATGMLLGLFWQQAAFLAHDTNHNGMIHPSERGLKGEFNFFGWFHGSVLFGISASRWLYEHNIHHAATLRPNEDPQFDYLPVWLQSLKELKGHGGTFQMTPLARFLVSVQHYTLIPLCMLVGRVNLCAINFIYALVNGVWADLAGMCIFWLWVGNLYYVYPGDFTEMMILIFVSHVCVGTLHVQLLISHLATEVFTREEELAMGFFEFQLRTSRNIDCPWYMHWFHGGLEYQIEHHLFPTLPRHNLWKVKPLIEALCARHNIPYMHEDFFGAIKVCLDDFEHTASALLFADLNA